MRSPIRRVVPMSCSRSAPAICAPHCPGRCSRGAPRVAADLSNTQSAYRRERGRAWRLVHWLDDEHDHRELRVIGDARDAVSDALKRQRFTELGPIRAKLRAQHLHRAIALRLESAKAKFLAQRVVGNERV